MNQEFNQIIMKNGKSKLFESLAVGRTIVVFIGENTLFHTVPDGIESSYFGTYYDFKTYCVWLRDLKDGILDCYDTIIVYSNKAKCNKLKYLESLSRIYDLDKWIFMFSSEM